MRTVYHYTNKEGRDAIRRSGKILESDGLEDDDAAYGKGVYFTTLSPDHGKETVGNNNWGSYKKAMKKGKLDYAIRIDIPEEKLHKVGKSRKIYVYNGNLVLRKYEHAFIKCRWEEDEDEDGAVSDLLSPALDEICVRFTRIALFLYSSAR